MLHGRGGEDGQLQGMLQMLGIPYTGSGILASALAMDKIKTKQIWLGSQLPTPAYCELSVDTDWSAVIDSLGEVVVKPSHEGSSIGMSMAITAEQLCAAFDTASVYDTIVMAERRIHGKEFTVPVIDGKTLPAIQLSTPHEFYDFDAKYQAADTEYLCPAPLSQDKAQELSQLCLDAFNALGATGWGRIDAMQDESGKFWLLELNTVPGMTDHSLVPLSADRCGWSFEKLVVTILQTSIARAAAGYDHD
jgi:D-alanine-D-alanine ligase